MIDKTENSREIIEKGDIASKLATASGLDLMQAEAIVNDFFDNMTAALVSGDRVELRKLLSMKITRVKAKKTKHPRTAESIEIPSKGRVQFRLSKHIVNSLPKDEQSA